MRRTIFSTIILILVLFSVSSAQVIEGDVSLYTQAEVNSFAGISVTGILIIQGSDIIDLTPLLTLTFVGGDLFLGGGSEWPIGNDALTNLAGLSNLASVGGSLRIVFNGALTNLDGLSSLTSVGGGMDVVGNDSLTNLAGLSNLTSVDGDLEVGGNPSLNIFCGLHPLLSLSGLQGSYTVSGNLLNPTQQQIIDDGPCGTTTILGTELLPKDYSLQQNYPNPFNPTTTIKYALPEQTLVQLTVFDIRGNEIVNLQDADKPPGNYEAQWNGMDQQGNQVSTGVYFCRIQAGNYSKTIKMVYLR